MPLKNPSPVEKQRLLHHLILRVATRPSQGFSTSRPIQTKSAAIATGSIPTIHRVVHLARCARGIHNDGDLKPEVLRWLKNQGNGEVRLRRTPPSRNRMWPLLRVRDPVSVCTPCLARFGLDAKIVGPPSLRGSTCPRSMLPRGSACSGVLGSRWRDGASTLQSVGCVRSRSLLTSSQPQPPSVTCSGRRRPLPQVRRQDYV